MWPILSKSGKLKQSVWYMDELRNGSSTRSSLGREKEVRIAKRIYDSQKYFLLELVLLVVVTLLVT